MIIDLKAYESKTEEVGLFDGSIIHLKKPTQKMIIELMGLQNIENEKDNLKAVEKINSMLLLILNNNTENKTFTVKYIKDNFDFELMYAFIQAYQNFAEKVNNQPF